jgi:hypothetical protein
MISKRARRASLHRDEVQRSAPVPPAGRQARGAETARFCRSPGFPHPSAVRLPFSQCAGEGRFMALR